jgi:hypothetical protein
MRKKKKKKKKAFCFCWSLQNNNTKKCHFLLAETMEGEKTTPTKTKYKTKSLDKRHKRQRRLQTLNRKKE